MPLYKVNDIVWTNQNFDYLIGPFLFRLKLKRIVGDSKNISKDRNKSSFMEKRGGRQSNV